MEIKELFAPPAIGDTNIARTRCEKKLCSNRSGHGTRCKRFAVEGRKRCAKCAACARRTRIIHWASAMVNQSKTSDKAKQRSSDDSYVNKLWLESLYKTHSNCYWCGAGYLTIGNRQRNGGLQIERLNNDLPHLQRNCVFACAYCNRRSWKPNWREEPYHLRKYRYCYHPKLSRVTKIRQDMICLELRSTFFKR